MRPGYSDESGITWALHLPVPRQSCLRLEQGTWRQHYMHLYLLVFAPVWLKFVDADVRVAGRPLPGARDGRAHALLQGVEIGVVARLH
eukprot:9214565-Heterocapsa_arctica.AAC.1